MPSTPPPELTDPTYTLTEAAALAGVSGQTVSNWFRGREGSLQTPLFADRLRTRDEPIRLSFLETSETIVAALLKRNGASMSRLRSAREFTRRRIPCEHPFATEQFKLTGDRILLEFEEQSPSVGKRDLLMDFDERAGQKVLPFYFTSALEQFEYQNELEFAWARRYHLYGRDIPLVIDPAFGSGRLTIADTNIQAESVFARIDSGYSVEDIVEDLRLPTEQVKAVIEFKRAA